MTATQPLTAEAVLAELRSIVAELLDDYDLPPDEVTADTTFHEDLGLESIDLVTVGAQLAQRYGERVNLAEFLAEKELDDVIGLRLGALVEFVLAAVEEV